MTPLSCEQVFVANLKIRQTHVSFMCGNSKRVLWKLRSVLDTKGVRAVPTRLLVWEQYAGGGGQAWELAVANRTPSAGRAASSLRVARRCRHQPVIMSVLQQGAAL